MRGKGLRNLIIVVGNDDNLSEITLVPLERDWAESSHRERRAFKEVDFLHARLDEYWKLRCKEESSVLRTFFPPKIEVSPALHAPRVLIMTHNREEDEQYRVHYRQPTLTSVCKASRRMVLNRWYQYLPLRDALTKSTCKFYNPSFDVVHLDLHLLGILRISPNSTSGR